MAKYIGEEEVYQAFARSRYDPESLILDVRDVKKYAGGHGHLYNAFCVRVTNNGRALLDYSKAHYNFKWSEGVWWDKPVIVYGPENLKKDHPVVTFLSKDGRTRSLGVYREGAGALRDALPFLFTTSTKAAAPSYPAAIVQDAVYLGDWEHAADERVLRDLNITLVVTVHNDPKNLRGLPKDVAHLPFVLADLETERIRPLFDVVNERVHDEVNRVVGKGKRRGAVLIHCGAGVSRSAALAMAYLMYRDKCTAASARERVLRRRTIAEPNAGFWRQLCEYEIDLGVHGRSDPNAIKSKNAAAETAAAEEAAKAPAAGPSFNEVAALAGSGVRRYECVVEMHIMKGEERVGKLVIEPGIQPGDRYVLGREQGSCEHVMEHLSISRAHAQLTSDAKGVVYVTDLGSSHGTNVDGAWVRAHAPKVLREGMVLRFGASTREYVVKRIEKREVSS
ncbi:unnamed protein product [Pedinophyceae sp. YPF-701]|nr:unnamed protein product [Pedinophyceae sp. YPF-701]